MHKKYVKVVRHVRDVAANVLEEDRLMELSAAFEYFITAKKGAGIRERAITDYT